MVNKQRDQGGQALLDVVGAVEVDGRMCRKACLGCDGFVKKWKAGSAIDDRRRIAVGMTIANKPWPVS